MSAVVDNPSWAAIVRYVRAARLAYGPNQDRRWRVWDLDGELRYMPVVRGLPDTPLPICEVGSGPQGLANWTDRPIIGIDPGADDRHGSDVALPNLQRLDGHGAAIPLSDGSAGATVAVDTFEHISRGDRAGVVAEMRRVTAPGGRILIMGPCGKAAETYDRRVLERWRQREGGGGNIALWLSEHEEIGLPSVAELATHLRAAGAQQVRAEGAFNIRLWYLMHRALLDDFPRPRGDYWMHHLAWLPFATLARRLRRGPYYRWLVMGEIPR